MIRFLMLSCCVVSSYFLAACGNANREAQKTAAILTGDDKKAAGDNPQCKLFSAADAARYIGEPAAAGQNAAMGMGCQWVARDGSGDMIVSVVPARYHEKPSLAKGYKALADVGTEGFVAPYLDGWLAGAIVGEEALRVSVAGAGASESTAIELLKETLKRRSK